MRLDEYLVNQKNIKSRNVAKQLIIDNYVYVNNDVCNKPSYHVKDNDLIDVKSNHLKFVSRAGYKLEHAIKFFNIDFKNKVVVDVGASTGGFSDCSLKYGAIKVYAIDVGTNQLDNKLLNDQRIVNLSNTNIKDINSKIINEEIDIVVSDISFISSKYMFENIVNLNLKKDCVLISLIKPQFELTKTILNKNKGKVIDKIYHQQAIDNVVVYAKQNNFKVINIIESPILGAKKENKEFLIWCKYEK